jgi:hypothetical protein
MTRQGFIAISRKLFDPEDAFFGGEPFTRREAWQWLIAEAAWKPQRKKVSTGRGETYVDLERGQLTHSRAFMCKAWGWSSEKRVRTFLDRLEMDGRIGRPSGQQEGHAQTVITITKYDEYQSVGVEKGQASGQEEGQALGQPRANQGPELEQVITKRKNNAQKRVGEPAGFEEWYSAYGRKVSRQGAVRAYAKVIASGEIAEPELLARTVRFAAYWARQPADRQRFKPYPASWLNDAGHFDECDPDGKPWSGQGRTPATAPVDPSSFSLERWRGCLSLHRRNPNDWGEHWGPPPGTEGCLVPAELLAPRREGVNEAQPPNFSTAA